MNYREVAETIRVARAYDKNRYKLVQNLLMKSHLNQWRIVYLMYASSSKHRLSDEDLREIYFKLTDLYPEEVEENPDIIGLLSELSRAKKTVAITDRVMDITKKVLDPSITNTERAALLRPVFFRVERQDLFYLILRLSVRKNVINRHDVIKALGRANGKLYRNLRKASFLIGMEKVCDRLSRNEEIQDVLTPPIGRPLIVPSPAVTDVDTLPFGKSYLEIPEGQWMTLHVMKGGVRLFDSGGADVEVEFDTLQMVESAKIAEGIYLVEYASGRDNELLILDQWSQDDDMIHFEKRRENISCAPWAIKPMIEIKDAVYYMEHVGIKESVLLWNAHGILSYENSIYEVGLLNSSMSRRSVFAVVGGVYTCKEIGAAPKLSKWRVAVRDGEDLYPVGLIESQTNLTRFTNPHKIIEGEEVTMISPVYVYVDVIGSGWGDYGAYIQGQITSVASEAGQKDCVGIDELEALSKGWEEGYDDIDRHGDSDSGVE